MTAGADANSAADDLTAAVREIALGMPAGHVRRLAGALSSQPGPGPAARVAASAAIPIQNLQSQIRRLLDAWERAPLVVGGSGLAIALCAAVEAVEQIRASQLIDIVWTGPATPEVPVRLTREVLLEVIGSASSTLLMVSFAAYHVPAVADAVATAARRGVDVRFVLETGESAGGTLKGAGAASAFKDLAGLVTFYEWPADQREALPAGRRAAMHVKTSIADEDTALITSANFTGSAIDTNMELGVLLRGGPVPRRLARHFRQLMVDGVLQKVS
jgi:phosphatidylserine/phosphatidylglycerophosphate/cardiolipin synthase-like enzyme